MISTSLLSSLSTCPSSSLRVAAAVVVVEIELLCSDRDDDDDGDRDRGRVRSPMHSHVTPSAAGMCHFPSTVSCASIENSTVAKYNIEKNEEDILCKEILKKMCNSRAFNL